MTNHKEHKKGGSPKRHPKTRRRSPSKRCKLKKMNEFYLVGKRQVVDADPQKVEYVRMKKRNGTETHALKYHGMYGKAFKFISHKEKEEVGKVYGKPKLYKRQ